MQTQFEQQKPKCIENEIGMGKAETGTRPRGYRANTHTHIHTHTGAHTQSKEKMGAPLIRSNE